MRPNQNIDWDNLGFDPFETRSMYIATCDSSFKWLNKGLVPYGEISLSPASAVLNYGQGVFEGTKAYMTSRGRVVFFRLEENAKRFTDSCRRLCIPDVPHDLFIDAVKETVMDNLDYIPENEKGSLYIRPLVWGTGPILGVKPADSYTFLIFVTPVGSYFKSGLKRLNALVTDKYHRIATKSIGNAKAIGNYSGTLLPFKEAADAGYDEIIFLNSSNENILDEARSANIFILKNKTLKTPSVQGSILPGITRDSVLKIATKVCNLDVREEDVTVEELMSADEVFFTGTAVVVAPVGSVCFNNNTKDFEKPYSESMTKTIREALIDIQNENIKDPFGWLTPVE